MYLGKGVWIMIIEFSIANFLSFKDKVTFSMLADTKEELADNYIVKDNKKILKTAAIYGANASGKTNIMKVVGTVVNILRECNNYNIDTELPIEPFKFSKDTKNQPSEFEIKFIADDTRYVYGFSATKKKVLEEYLYYYPNNREAIIFDRTNTNEYEFNIEDKKIINDIKNKTNENKFFLATSATWNFTKVKTPYTFLSSILVSSNSNNFNNSLFKLLNDYEKEIKPFTLNMLKDADLNIEDYKIVDEALKTVGMFDFIERDFSTLSGGEQQRVILARALAQQTPCLILDEPTNHLDITHQLQLMRMVKNLNVTVISAIHDLNIAAMFCDRIYVLKDGEIVGQGKTEEVLTRELIRDIYKVETEIVRDHNGQMHILFL